MLNCHPADSASGEAREIEFLVVLFIDLHHQLSDTEVLEIPN